MILKEGGNVFPGTTSFDQKIVPDMMDKLNRVLQPLGTEVYPIGSGATPTPGKMSGDLDMVIDYDHIAKHFNSKDQKAARQDLEQLFSQAGFNTAKTGTSVHVEVPMNGETHQVDIMVVPNAAQAKKFHVHDIPKDSQYKGVHKQIALAYLAKQKGLLWSPYQGLFKRLPNGKKDPKGFLTHDTEEVAKTLLGPNASFKDLGSFESIMAAMPDDAAQQMLADLRQSDPDKFSESAELARIKELSGL